MRALPAWCTLMASRSPTARRMDAAADAVTASGETFLTATVLDGVPTLRAAFSNWRTTDADVDRMFAAIAAACADS